MRIYLGLLFCLTIVLLSVSGATAASVTLTWTATGDDGLSGRATVYDIRYSLSTITNANWASATKITGLPAPKVSGSAETLAVTGLTSNTTYYFAMKVGDDVPNWSLLSNVIQKSTSPETIAPAAIANLGAANETSTSVTLSWTAPGDDGNVGTASQYDIRYSTAAITAANFASATKTASAPTPRAAGGAESFTVTGLSAGTTYYFAVKTADEVPNWAVISNVVSRTTLVVAPTALALIFPVDPPYGILYNLKPEFLWSYSPNPGPGDTVRFRLELATDPGFLDPLVVDSLTQNHYTVPDSLEFNQRYWWRVKAFDQTNLITLSDTKDFWTWTLGDVDHSHVVTMADLTVLIDHLFTSLTPLDPLKSGDLDGDCVVTMGDLTMLVDHLFISLNPLTDPGCEW